MAFVSVLAALRRHEVLSETAIDAALAEAERNAESGVDAQGERSSSNAQAVLFPIRLLRLANSYGSADLPAFAELAARVGMHNHESGRD